MKKPQAKKDAVKEVESKPYPLVPLILVLLYALVELVPQFDAVDVMGSQWLYLSFLNIGTIAYLIYTKKYALNSFFKSSVFIAFTGLVTISLISFFAAYNVVESLVTYSRLIMAMIAFINLYTLIRGDKKLITHALIAISAVLIVQSLMIIAQFFELTGGDMALDQAVLELRGNTGNKNFMGVSILLRIPFVLFLLHQRGVLMKVIGVVGLFIVCLALFIINSRSTFVGLALELFIYFCGLIYLFVKEKDKTYLWKIPIFIGLVSMSFVTTQTLISNAKADDAVTKYGDVSQRIKSIGFTNKGSSGRVDMWNAAVDFIKKNPMLGGGYGNWKIHQMPYEMQKGFGVKKHAHNDYLEITADTGILGGLFFIAFFLILVYYALRVIMKYGDSVEIKVLTLILLMSLAGYMSDSFFNFPMERPNTFLMMFFVAASIVGIYLATKSQLKVENESHKIHTFVMWGSLALCVPLVYLSLQVYKSQAVQRTIFVEWFGKPTKANPPFKSEDINHRFPSIPNLSENVMPIACMKAKYLCEEGKFEEANKILDADDSNPYIYYKEFLKANMFSALNQPDSARYYAEKAFYGKPYNDQIYDLVYNMALNAQDTTAMREYFNVKTNLVKRRIRTSLFLKHAQTFYLINKDYKERLETIERGIEIVNHNMVDYASEFYEDSVDLNFELHFIHGVMSGNENKSVDAIKHYQKALEMKVDDSQANLNIGLEYFKLKEWEKALEYLTNAALTKEFNGRAEYYRAHVYNELGQVDKACADFYLAASLGYQVESQNFQYCRENGY